MEVIYVGIDIAKDTFAVVVRKQDQNGKARTFKNTAKGITALIHWLPDPKAVEVRPCLEATGAYGEELAEQLHLQGMKVSVVNPFATKRYAQSGLLRNQTDPVDAGMLAEFCQNKHPRVWTPSTEAQKSLRALSRRLEDLQKMLTMERNRLKSSQHLPESIQTSIQQVIAVLQAQIQDIKAQLHAQIKQDPELCRQRKLLVSIKGIGQLTAERFLAELGDLRQFENAKQLSAYLGLTPTWKTSGTSVQTKPRLSKRGPAGVRQFLYMPAIVAKRFNQIVSTFCDRLTSARKSDMSIIGAAMHKLVHLMYGVVHSGLPFDPDYLKTSQAPS